MTVVDLKDSRIQFINSPLDVADAKEKLGEESRPYETLFVLRSNGAIVAAWGMNSNIPISTEPVYPIPASSPEKENHG